MECMSHSTNVVQPKGNTMNNNNPVNNLLKAMKDMGVPVPQELEVKLNNVMNEVEAKVVEYRGPQTKREEKIYNAAEKVEAKLVEYREKAFDKTFVGYGKAKEKVGPAVEATVNATKKAVVKSRGWVGGLIKKLGEKIEPKS